MIPQIDKETILCISLAGRPGNFGNRFHNFLYEKLGLNYIYKSCTTTNLEDAIRGVRALGIRGCSISMPYKEDVIKLLDRIDTTAGGIEAVNTIVNDKGFLTGYNTDYIAVRDLIKKTGASKSLAVTLHGSGGMAKAVACALQELGFKRCLIVSRNQNTGTYLAEKYGYKWQKDFDPSYAGILINATPVGMRPDPEDTLSFPKSIIEASKYIFDVIADPAETGLIKLGNSLGKTVQPGFDIMVIQAVEQLKLYASVTPPEELVGQAAVYARAK